MEAAPSHKAGKGQVGTHSQVEVPPRAPLLYPARSCLPLEPPSRFPRSNVGILKLVGGWGAKKGQTRVRSGLCGARGCEAQIHMGAWRAGVPGQPQPARQEGVEVAGGGPLSPAPHLPQQWVWDGSTALEGGQGSGNTDWQERATFPTRLPSRPGRLEQQTPPLPLGRSPSPQAGLGPGHLSCSPIPRCLGHPQPGRQDHRADPQKAAEVEGHVPSEDQHTATFHRLDSALGVAGTECPPGYVAFNRSRFCLPCLPP